MGHVDALVHGRSFLSVWGNADDAETPLITVESAHADTVASARRRTATLDCRVEAVDRRDTAFATLYLPDAVVRYRCAHQPLTGWAAAGPWKPFDVHREPARRRPGGAVREPPAGPEPRRRVRADRRHAAGRRRQQARHGHLVASRSSTRCPAGTRPASRSRPAPHRERLQAEVAAYWDQATKGKTWLAGQGVHVRPVRRGRPRQLRRRDQAPHGAGRRDRRPAAATTSG